MAHDTTQTSDAPAHTDHGHDDHQHHGTGLYWVVFFALMVLLLLTVGVAYFNLGHFNVPVAYLIASLKALLILWFFMHLSETTRLVQVFALASFAWLAIFLIMIFGDYVSRGLLPRAEELTTIRQVDSWQAQSGLKSNQIKPIGEEGKHAAPKHGEATPATQPAHGH